MHDNDEFIDFVSKVILKVQNNDKIEYHVKESYICIISEDNEEILFYKNGDVFCRTYFLDVECWCIARHRTYDQMLMIIEGLL